MSRLKYKSGKALHPSMKSAHSCAFMVPHVPGAGGALDDGCPSVRQLSFIFISAPGASDGHMDGSLVYTEYSHTTVRG